MRIKRRLIASSLKKKKKKSDTNDLYIFIYF